VIYNIVTTKEINVRGRLKKPLLLGFAGDINLLREIQNTIIG
jgi:hypothetical protein